MKLNLEIKGKHSFIESVSIEGIKARKLSNADISHCRQVFIWQDALVIKFDSSIDNQCKDEIEFMESVDPMDACFFVPVLEHGVFNNTIYTVQEYVPNDDNFTVTDFQPLHALEKEYSKCDFRPGDNVAIYKGQIKIFDYAV